MRSVGQWVVEVVEHTQVYTHNTQCTHTVCTHTLVQWSETMSLIEHLFRSASRCQFFCSTLSHEGRVAAPHPSPSDKHTHHSIILEYTHTHTHTHTPARYSDWCVEAHVADAPSARYLPAKSPVVRACVRGCVGACVRACMHGFMRERARVHVRVCASVHARVSW